MDRVQLSIQKRTETGKGPSGRLKAGGFIPAVLYGKKVPGFQLPIKIEAKAVKKSLGSHPGGGVLVELIFDEETDGSIHSYTAIVKDAQMDPIRGELSHLDFQQVSMDEAVSTTVPLHYVGQPEGVRQGGVLQYQAREIEVKGMPGDLPMNIEVEISHLSIGDNLTASSLSVPAGVQILTDSDEVLVTVLAPRVEMPEEKAGEEEAAKEEA